MPDDPPLVLLDDRFREFEPAFAPFLRLRTVPFDQDLGALEAREGPIRAVITAGNRPIPAPVLALERMGLVALLGSGYQGLDLSALAQRGIVLTTAAGLNAPDVATHAVAMFLALNRDLVRNHDHVLSGGWRGRHVDLETRSLDGLKVGVLGLGAIGRGIAARLQAFGCDCAWWGPNSKAGEPLPRRASLADLADWCDVLFIAARADTSNNGLVDRAVIEAVGQRGSIVNISRGTIIDEDALIAALRDGRLGGAALDVFDPEPTPPGRWQGVPNVVLSPHRGGAGDQTRRATVNGIVDNIRRFVDGQKLPHAVALAGL